MGRHVRPGPVDLAPLRADLTHVPHLWPHRLPMRPRRQRRAFGPPPHPVERPDRDLLLRVLAGLQRL